MKIYGMLERAALEVIADPTATIVGRIWWNSSEGKAKIADGSNSRALLRNDGAAILGNSGTASQNIRLHRGAAAVLQFVTADDTTAEGSLTTALAQLSFKLENYTTAGLPAAGRVGRLAWDTTLGFPVADNGAAWKTLATTDGTQTLTNKTFDTANNTLKSGAATANQVLSANGSGGTAWQTPTTPNSAVTTKTANYTLTGSDTLALGDATGGTFTFTLPTAVSNSGKVYQLKKIDSSTNAVAINTTSSQTIDGVTSASLANQWEMIEVISDGTNWQTLRALKRPTIQQFASGSGTYTKPAGVKWIRVILAGGGGGGSGAGNVGTSGSDGNDTTFGSSFLTGSKGLGGGASGTGGVGGAATIAAGATGLAVPGGSGSSGGYTGTPATSASGGSGGSNPFGGGGGSGGDNAASDGQAGATNTGAGGGGGSTTQTAGRFGGTGGGAGGYVNAVVQNPAATYSYAVGAGGAAGTGTTNGGAGAAGIVYVEEFYQ